jgi:hypothetical protein
MVGVDRRGIGKKSCALSKDVDAVRASKVLINCDTDGPVERFNDDNNNDDDDDDDDDDDEDDEDMI